MRSAEVKLGGSCGGASSLMLTGRGLYGGNLDSCSVGINSTGFSIVEREIKIAVEIGMLVSCGHVL